MSELTVDNNGRANNHFGYDSAIGGVPTSRSKIRETHAMRNLENRLNIRMDKLNEKVHQVGEKAELRFTNLLKKCDRLEKAFN